LAAATSFFDRLQPYVAEWASAAHEENIITEHRCEPVTTRPGKYRTIA
jgi:hypothetical protein